jgi:ubiquitin-conjugating enzyme E2 variant
MKMFTCFILQFAATVLAADFVAGVIHWLEDAYIRENTPLLGRRSARPNIIHHHYPRQMTRHNWWQSSWDLLLLSVPLVLVAWEFHFLTWRVWLFAALVANANEIHKWAHRTRRENGRLISCLQDIRLLQTSRHHASHHTDPKNSRYCTTTNFLNPILDRLRFWDGFEWLIAKSLGIHRRADTSVQGFGPGPEWLKEFRRPPK